MTVGGSFLAGGSLSPNGAKSDIETEKRQKEDTGEYKLLIRFVIF